MEHKIVEEAIQGDQEALVFLRAMARVLHFWDDMIDRDHPLDDATINARMWDALIVLPTNGFYRDHIDVLSPILVSAIANWRIATAIERDDYADPIDLKWAFVIRSTYVDLVVMCAHLIGGLEHAVACGPAVRRWAHAEGFGGYLDNLAAETAARKANHVL